MMRFDNMELLPLVNNVAESYKQASTAPLYFDKFLKKSLPALAQRANRVYPYTVRIPKSIDRLLMGDFEPAYEIVINEPITVDGGTPIWFGDSTDGVDLHFGYKNGDSRFLSDVKLNDSKIHALLVGRTGMGKSVTTNSIVSAMCFQYAPWEVKLTMIDAKVVEFKRYALGDVIPHVSSVAATSDADYMISILESLKQEMLKLNSVFSKLGVQNIADFRKKTKLALPQNIIITDEFQTGFKNAGKRVGILEDLYDEFSRLGRNTGYHLYLASQEIGTALKKETLNQISIRCALGCTPDVSNIALNNDEAGSITQKGRLLVNVNPTLGDKKDNVLYRVPFQPGDLFQEQKSLLSTLGSKYNFKYNLSFYDEQSVLYEENYKQYIESFNNTAHKIYLGEPSFVMHDKEKSVKLEMTGEDVENILVLCNNRTHLERYCKMLKYNFMTLKNSVRHVVVLGDKFYENKCKLSELTDKVYDVRSYDDVTWTSLLNTIYNRKLMLEADNEVFSNITTSEQSEAIFYSLFDKGSKYDTELNRGRCYYLAGLMDNPTYRKGFQMADLSDSAFATKRNTRIKTLIESYASYNSADTKLTLDKVYSVYFWIAGFDKILGYVRDHKEKATERLKQILLDCTDVNVRFIILSTSLEDNGQLRTGIRYFIFDDTPTNELRYCKCEDYPEVKAKVLGVLYDSLATGDKILKFKKMYMEGELLE